MPTIAITGQTTFGASTTGTTTQLDNNFLLAYNALNSFNQYSNYLQDTGAANAYIVTKPAGTTLALSAGLTISFRASAANTGASTLNADGTGAKNILDPQGIALGAGAIVTGQICTVMYDGTQYFLLSGVPAHYKVRTFTRVMSVASGNVAYTGVGFKPKALIFLANVLNGAVKANSVGFDDGTTRMQLLNYTTTGADAGFNQTANAIYLFDDAATLNVNTAVVASFDADGFTLTWTKSGTPTNTANCGYLAIG